MIKQIAKEWCIKKWEWIVENWDYSINYDESMQRMGKDIPKLTQFCAGCAYCEKYTDCGYRCNKCPLLILTGKSCRMFNSIFRKWINVKTKRTGIKYAKIMLDDIKRS